MQAAVFRYRVMAYVTGVMLLALCVSIGFQIAGHPTAEHITGTAHGFLYIVYLLTVAELYFRARWPLGKVVLVALAGTIPVCSFIAERKVVAWQRARARDVPAAAAAN